MPKFQEIKTKIQTYVRDQGYTRQQILNADIDQIKKVVAAGLTQEEQDYIPNIRNGLKKAALNWFDRQVAISERDSLVDKMLLAGLSQDESDAAADAVMQERGTLDLINGGD